ncbi:zinc-binding protein A33-like [Anguilla anguilla]|uniref:zinc-binding protein A33-like n=1 Tax=Anguilla anguilla TaxID=7936 RepID=UPI0015B374DC|nr:zinc-binding protein A33-like [Anguilla anguilla]
MLRKGDDGLAFGILPELNLFDWNIQEVCNRGEPLTMAERPLLTEFLRCHVCSEIFKDPVSLHCNHSFCKMCIYRLWEKKNIRNCPICNRRSSMTQPDVNFSLKVLADSYVQRKESEAGEEKEVDFSKERVTEEEIVKVFRKEGSVGGVERVTMCNKHTERPRWFCVDERMALCPLCESEHHSTHKIISLEESVSDLKEKLKRSLKPVQDQLVKCQKFKTQYEKVVQCTKKQALVTEKQIKAEFEKLHQFLREEEEARLAALREEEKKKGEAIIEELKKIQEQISCLSDRISTVEQELKEQDVPFLKKFSQTSVRAQCTLQDPELLSGALIDVAKHLGNLKFRVWEKMLEMVQYTPVTLDPNSAHPRLSLSDDLTNVRYADITQPLPDNPERFNYCVNVLGSEGFTSGKHSWEVDVKNKPQWTIGVAKESIGRKGQVTCSPLRGYWVLLLRDGDQYYSASGTHLTLERKPQKIRVELDYDKGEVSFFDPSDMSHIYTFIDTFTERVFPYISPCGNDDGSNPGALQICPLKVSITVVPLQ